MPYIVKPRFRPMFVLNSIRLVLKREVQFEKYATLDRAKEEAEMMVAKDGAPSASVYHLDKNGRNTFKLRWESSGNRLIMISGV